MCQGCTGYGACLPNCADHLPAMRECHAGGRGWIWKAEPSSPCLLHLRLRGRPLLLGVAGWKHLVTYCAAHKHLAAKITCQVQCPMLLWAVQVFQIAVTSTYGVTDFKENLLALYNKAGVKGIQVTFLITDNQIINERFLVYINDFLSTGFITDLCTPVSCLLCCKTCSVDMTYCRIARQLSVL